MSKSWREILFFYIFYRTLYLESTSELVTLKDTFSSDQARSSLTGRVDFFTMPTDKATELIHLTYDGNFQLETDATVLLCRVISDETNGNTEIKASNEVGDARTVPIELQLDITTMHPQGGGQPTDIGTIVPLLENPNSDDTPHSAVIDKVTIDRATGIVTHAGSITLNKNDPSLPPSGFFPEHSKVRVSVNQANRRLLSECHTAGHVVDAAMAKCDKLLPPTKGYHFMDGPYVEYKGSIDVKEREDFLQMLKVAYQVNSV